MNRYPKNDAEDGGDEERQEDLHDAADIQERCPAVSHGRSDEPAHECV